MNQECFNTPYLKLVGLKQLKEQGKLIYNKEQNSYRVPLAAFNVLRTPVSDGIYKVDPEVLDDILKSFESKFIPVDLDSDIHGKYNASSDSMEYIFSSDSFDTIGIVSNFSVREEDDSILIEADFQITNHQYERISEIMENPNDLTRFGLLGVMEINGSVDRKIIKIVRFQLLHDDIVESTNPVEEVVVRDELSKLAKQYYYRTNNCRSQDSTDPKCECWHNEGEGPFPDAIPSVENTALGMYDITIKLTWRDSPEIDPE